MEILNLVRFITNHPLNRHNAVGAMFRFLRWQIGSRLLRAEIIYPWINGAKMIVRNGETGFTQNIYCGLHEFSEMAYLLHVLRKEDLFVDVGANVGSYTILAGAVVGARAICFEPVPLSYDRLVANLRINQLEETVRPVKMAIGNENGTVLFTKDRDTMNHVVNTSEPSDFIEVEIGKLDVYLEEEYPSLIKIDVEGFETRVLEGAENTLKKESLHSLIIELNGNGSRYGFVESKIVETLSRLGFQPYDYDPFNRSFKQLTTKNLSSGNTLFLRNLIKLENLVKHSPKYIINGSEI